MNEMRESVVQESPLGTTEEMILQLSNKTKKQNTTIKSAICTVLTSKYAQFKIKAIYFGLGQNFCPYTSRKITFRTVYFQFILI